MESRLIEIPHSYLKSAVAPKDQYQQWVARFCYASAKLPRETVEHILSLMETCGESFSPDEEQ